ncbi:hypothetical protein E2C01_009919 [Portunus trituberculatus]|uniref:Uncharacterized protein n=1 Tax=Portunus trituberculatus TaxID=210409 RepID=A0A5B7D728_PORTR|nr:hypothetical protein [Portunus trituberculatus]
MEASPVRQAWAGSGGRIQQVAVPQVQRPVVALATPPLSEQLHHPTVAKHSGKFVCRIKIVKTGN